jgi:hypothetical protein
MKLKKIYQFNKTFRYTVQDIPTFSNYQTPWFPHDTHSSNHHIDIQSVPTVVLPFHMYHPTVLSHFPSTVTLPVHILLCPTEQFCKCQLLNDQTL